MTPYTVVRALAIFVAGLGTLWAGTNLWTSLGPQGAPVSALAIDPQNASTVYAATGAGLFKSADGGASWSALNSGLPCCIGTLVIDPQTPSTLYALTSVTGLSLDRGVLKSTDGGMNWSAVSSGLPVDAGGFYGITSLTIDPRNPTTLYAGNDLIGGGVFKTTNGGESWDVVNSGLTDGGVVALAISPQNSGTIYASTRTLVFPPTNTNGVFQSTDGGANWSAVNSGLGFNITRGFYYFSALAIDPQNPSTVYAAGPYAGVFKTTDAGASWTELRYVLRADTVFTFAIDPRDGTVYAGTSAGVFKSSDGGTSWSAVKSRLMSDAGGPLVIPALAIDPQNPDNVYAAGPYAGVFKTTDAGASWTAVHSDPTSPTGLIALRIDPQNPDTIYAATDIGVFKTTDAGTSWAAMNVGLPNDANGHITISTLAINPQTPSTIYATYAATSADEGTSCCSGEIFKSTDGGANWTAAVRGAALWAGTLAIDPRNPRTLYAAGAYIQAGFNGGQPLSGVFKTTNEGASWAAVSSGLPACTNRNCFGEVITTLAIDPQNPSTVYAGTSLLGSNVGSVVSKTRNGGASWKNSGLTGYFRVDILAIDPQNPNTVYARAIAQCCGSLFKTTNGGASWTALNSGLPSYVTALAIDPQNPSTLYAGGAGVFRSTDGGANWNAMNSGLTTLSVTTLAIDPKNPSTIYAGTADGGVFAVTFVPPVSFTYLN